MSKKQKLVENRDLDNAFKSLTFLIGREDLVLVKKQGLYRIESPSQNRRPFGPAWLKPNVMLNRINFAVDAMSLMRVPLP